MKYTYEMYRVDAINAGAPPLTRREWEMEGGLSFSDSKRRSDACHDMKEKEFVDTLIWSI